MKNKFFLIALILLTVSSCANKSEILVESYIFHCNQYDMEKATSLLLPGYQEIYSENYIEIEGPEGVELKYERLKILEHKTILKSIRAQGDTVFTEEQYSNIMDDVLEKHPRVFSVKYVIEEGKIARGYFENQINGDSIFLAEVPKYDAFYAFCREQGIKDTVYSKDLNELKGYKNALIRYRDREK